MQQNDKKNAFFYGSHYKNIPSILLATPLEKNANKIEAI